MMTTPTGEAVIKSQIRTPMPDLTAVAKSSQSQSAPSILTNKFITHHPKSGFNPLVDAAAYLFSIIGKLKLLKSYRNLTQLQKELIQEINHFQEVAKSQNYSAEYILVSRYALCATLDDTIGNTIWGGQGQWDSFNVLTVFNQETASPDRFFVILERIIKEPGQYIDVMELMYICLSLGYKGNYRATEFGVNHLEQITNALYKRIRIHRGDYNKILAPYILKPAALKNHASRQSSLSVVFLTTAALIFTLFIGFGHMLDTFSTQTIQELSYIGNSLLYEKANTSS